MTLLASWTWPAVAGYCKGVSTRRSSWWTAGRALLLGFAGAFATEASAVAQAPPTLPPAGEPVLPAPRLLDPGHPADPSKQKPGQPYGSVRPNHREQNDRILGGTPVAGPKTAEKYQKYFKELIDPEANLDLILARTRLLILKETPKRIQIGNDAIAEYNLLGKDQLILMGRAVGQTTFTLWFTDPKDPNKEDLIVYNLRVLPDPERVQRLERAYKALETQINCAFPNSVVCLHLVGDKLVITGNAMDIAEATQIVRIVRANAAAPGGQANVSRIPLDRMTSSRNPNDTTERADQPATPGYDAYVLDGSNFIVNMLRVPGEQTVNLRVTIAEVNREATRSIGMNFTVINDDGMPIFANATGALGITGNAAGAGVGVGGGMGGSCIPFCPGIPVGQSNILAAIDNGQVNLAINALRQVNYAKILAEPNLVAINGQTAQFQAGGEIPIPVIASTGNIGGTALTGVQFRQYGVNLNFTPYITDRDRIRLVLDANITGLNQNTGFTNIGGSIIPYFNSRRVNTTVEMREGQTLAVAGLIKADNGGDGRRVPFLGDLPFLTNLFGVNRVTSSEQELIMVVTPELVHPLDGKNKIPLPGSDLFEPTDIEFYLLGRLESHRQVDFRSQIMTDWQRVRNYRALEQSFIAGPTGYCGTP